MLEIILSVVVIVLLIILFLLVKKVFELKKDYEQLRHLKASQSVKYGQLTEQWVPFSDKYPYNAQNFRFIGSPIDGLSFEEDKVVFVEFKTATSRLSEKQRKIKELIQDKKVDWFELKIK